MSDDTPAGSNSAGISWRKWLVGGLALAALLALTYAILTAFIPRWWAQQIAVMSGHGSFTKGIGSGLTLGLLGTLLPLLLLLMAVLLWNWRAGKFIGGAVLVLAVIFAIPNLMTLSIVLGTSGAAHAGQRVLDVDAPGFRGASAIGAAIGAAIALLVGFVAVRKQYRAQR
ncbi:MAG: permease [Segniliparus sp.]|uniref:permease n=1 Tax=Segniliparus sp. TaxID=2804064 RepID=UPI003F393B5F